MQTFTKDTALGNLGLPSGEHWVRLHVGEDDISIEIAASAPELVNPSGQAKPTGFVQRWGASAKKMENSGDAWLEHINQKHLR